ncbi:MAG TPA: M56 family metallopeptidase [Blastocatellia bacterium]|nr:M56 family metallopeptidase [Blastocatellia bacterium]
MILNVYSAIMSFVVEPAIRALLFGGLIGLIVAIARLRDVRFKLSCWTLVLYAALAMPVLALVLPRVALPLSSPGIASSDPGSARFQRAQQDATTDSATARFQRALSDPATVRSGSIASQVKRTDQVSETILPSTNARDCDSQAAATVLRDEPRPPAARRDLPWQPVAVGFYLLVTFALLLQYLAGIAIGRRVKRRAERISDPEVIGRLSLSGREIPNKRLPLVLQSPEISVPVTVGVLKPAILLPDGWRDWSESKLVAVLTHELSHVVRRDTLTQALSIVHRALFWFSPLSWVLHRRLIDLAEQASDEQAVRVMGDAGQYAEILLGFFDAARAGGGRTRLAGVCMAQGSRAEKRIDRILSGALASSRRFQKPAAAALSILVVSLACVAATLTPYSYPSDLEAQMILPPARATDRADCLCNPATALDESIAFDCGQDRERPAAPSAPAIAAQAASAPAPEAPAAPGVPPVMPVILGLVPAAGIAPVAPTGPAISACARPSAAPLPRVLPMSPLAPAPAPCANTTRSKAPTAPDVQVTGSQTSPTTITSTTSTTDTTDNSTAAGSDPFAVSSGRHRWVSGSRQDLERAHSVEQNVNADHIWFRRNGREYLITDPGTVKKAAAFFASLSESSEKQELARLQGQGQNQGQNQNRGRLSGEQERRSVQASEGIQKLLDRAVLSGVAHRVPGALAAGSQ